MKSKRRTQPLVVAALASALGVAATVAVHAQTWAPTEAIKIVVHTPAGAGSDVVARAIADIVRKEKLTTQPVEVLNKAGAGGMNAITFTDQQKGNAHYLMAITNVFLATPLRQKSKLTFEDFTMVSILAEDANAIQVNAKSSYKTLQDLITAAKAKPKAVSIGVGSIGGTDHMLSYAIGKATGVEFNVVSFDGGSQAATAMMGGHVDFITGGPSETKGQIDAGLIRPVAVIGKDRLSSIKNTPTTEESGVKLGATFAVVRGFVLPGGVPAGAAEYYAALLDKVAATPAWKDFASKNDFVATKVGPKEMKAFLAKRNSEIKDVLTAMGVLK